MAYIRVAPGMRYGRLVVVSFHGNTNAGKKIWECLCDCGGKAFTTSGRLNSGHTKSCGCLSREVARENRLSEAKHGATSNAKPTPTYISWVSMRRRCLSETDKDYNRWGARGVKIDPRWDDFSVFLADMGERPKGKTLDRIDNNGHYCKENCRWATQKTQSRNQRTTKLSEQEIDRILKDDRPQAKIAKEFGVSQSTISLIKNKKRWA